MLASTIQFTNTHPRPSHTPPPTPPTPTPQRGPQGRRPVQTGQKESGNHQRKHHRPPTPTRGRRPGLFPQDPTARRHPHHPAHTRPEEPVCCPPGPATEDQHHTGTRMTGKGL